jgi:hypothetical protein
MDFLSVFFDVFGEPCIRFEHENALSGAFPRPRDEADSVGTVERCRACDGLHIACSPRKKTDVS